MCDESQYPDDLSLQTADGTDTESPPPSKTHGDGDGYATAELGVASVQDPASESPEESKTHSDGG